MKVQELRISGLKLISLNLFRDERGFFVERFHEDKFRELGLPTDFVQDNHSFSVPNVIRGLHFQSAPAQGKLVGVTRGRIFDVAVDLRKNSPTFGQWEGVELDAQNGKMLWLPEGFAHGFSVLGDEPADVLYKVTARFNTQTDSGIRFDDPQLAINWRVPASKSIVSAKDRQLQSFSDYAKAPIFSMGSGS